MRPFRRLKPPSDCVGCKHSQADHYPGCVNVGPAPEFDHCKCQRFLTVADSPNTQPPDELWDYVERLQKHWLQWESEFSTGFLKG